MAWRGEAIRYNCHLISLPDSPEGWVVDLPQRPEPAVRLDRRHRESADGGTASRKNGASFLVLGFQTEDRR